MSNRVLVTGGTGFIGSHLVSSLVKEARDVHLLVRKESDLSSLQDLLSSLTLHRVSLQDQSALRECLQKIAPSAVFHLAAYGASCSHTQKEQIFESNVIGSYHLLRALEEIDYDFCLYMGGSSEYGDGKSPMQEAQALHPQTFYGASKACSTMLFLQQAKEQRKPIAIVRPFSVYGPFESKKRLIPKAILAALQGTPLPLTPPGMARDFVFVEDVVEACLLCWKGRVTGEIINVGTGVQTTNEEVVHLIEELMQTTIDVIPGAYTPHLQDKQRWAADMEKTERLLKWRPPHTLKEGLEKTIAWISQGIYV